MSATPFLKWAGGKGQLLQQMQEFWPPDWDTYLEPFLGGGAVFLRLAPERAIIGDLNDELMNCYRVVQTDVDLLMEALDEHQPHKTNKQYFYEVRKPNPAKLNPVDRAARTIFLNKTCYNGLYRVNSKGEFNVPFGRYKNPQLYDEQTLRQCAKVLRTALLATADYRDLLTYARSGDFVYLDPPYQVVSETANFTGYTKDQFAEEDQVQLAEVYTGLDERNCKVMLSNSDTPLVRKLYNEYRIEELKAKRAISSKASTRGEITELLILNYETS